MKRTLAAILYLLAIAGCGQVGDSAATRQTKGKMESLDQSYALESRTVTKSLELGGSDSTVDTAARGGPGAIETPADRKIIYTANMSIVVKSFDKVEPTINQLVETHDGYVASFHEDRSRGSNRAATWVLRVPVGGFNDVLDAVAELGVPESRNVDSEDVSEQFVDLDAQLKNRRRLETEMLELLENRDGELKDILAIKHELASVREAIERIEGRLRYLSDRVDLTTITLNVREEKDYVPAQAPTFASRIDETWKSSLAGLRTTGEEIVLLAVGAAPWLAIVALLLMPPLWLLRRRVVARSVQ
jgi:hypothetical protein